MHFKDAPAMPVADIMKSIRDLKLVIPQIGHYTEGANCSTEGLTQGYTNGFTIHFENKADRDAYLVNKHHVNVANNNITPNVISTLVFDYETSD